MSEPVFQGKTALVTGGSSGIGLAISAALNRKGANVISLSRSDGEFAKLQGSATKHGIGWVRAQHCDISDSRKVAEVLDALRQQGVGIDILVNNAGIALGAPKTLWEQDLDDVHKIIAVNVLGLVNVSYAALKTFFVPSGKGTILTISSVTGLEVPQKGMGEVIYHATKSFTEGFINTLRNELLGTDIRALVLRPGFVRTNFHFDRTGRNDTDFEKVFEGLEVLSPEDVADAAVFALAQPERLSIKALDLVPTGQRSLSQVDRQWNARHRAGAH